MTPTIPRSDAETILAVAARDAQAATDAYTPAELVTAGEAVGIPAVATEEVLRQRADALRAAASREEERRARFQRIRTQAVRGLVGFFLVTGVVWTLATIHVVLGAEHAHAEAVAARDALDEAHRYAVTVNESLAVVTDPRDRGAMVQGAQTRLHVARGRYARARLEYERRWRGTEGVILRHNSHLSPNAPVPAAP